MYPDPTLYRDLVKIRKFEEIVFENFAKGYFTGTTHSYLGQEANAVGVLYHIQEQDIVVSNHRCHGHFLAYGGEARDLFAEMMGKSTGVCGGRGGSQHLHWKRFFSNGIQGGFVPIAVGMGLAVKKKAQESIVINFIGDGTLGEGILYEGLNIASLWEIPILFVLENNRIAQTTPIELAVSGNIQSRFEAFDITCSLLETSDIREILPVTEDIIDATRKLQKPHALVLNTHRFGPHSKGDDTRSKEEVSRLIKHFDPVAIERSHWDEAVIHKIDAEVESELLAAFNDSIEDPVPVL